MTLQFTPTCIEHDLAFQHLLAQGLSHWRMEMTDSPVPPPLTDNESPRS